MNLSHYAVFGVRVLSFDGGERYGQTLRRVE